MSYRNQLKGAAFAALCAATLAACESGMQTPVSPSAVAVAGANATSPDGSTLKATAPIGIFPLFESTNVVQAPSLAARASFGRFATGVALPHRFQVSDSESFTNIMASGIGAVDASGIVRFTVDPALPTNRRVVWRVRAELDDSFGPWSNVMAFTTRTGTITPTTPTAGPRPADPPAGTRLPLPDMRGVLARFSDVSQSCPRGIKYVNSPWQDRVIDDFRQSDSRWGYNGKPTRSAADNGGFPVVAAGDEAAYHYSGGADQGSFDVHLVDMLIGHCGPGAFLGWRVFTDEEAGFWTGAGRF